MNFGDEQIRILAEVEQKMDSGEFLYVVYDGKRMPVVNEIMLKYGLKQGQTINSDIFQAIVISHMDHIMNCLTDDDGPSEEDIESVKLSSEAIINKLRSGKHG